MNFAQAVKGKPYQEFKEAAVPENGKAANFTCKSLVRVQNAHSDDVHGLIRLGDGTFISGSKDGCLKRWNREGELVTEVYTQAQRDYREWITALAPAGENLWLSGTRNGHVDLWNKGEHVSSLSASPSTSKSHRCKLRNANRVNCIASADYKDHGIDFAYYVGWPTQFTEQHTNSDSRISKCVTSVNDWVYCIKPWSEKSLLVVTGPNLDLWRAPSKDSPSWRFDHTLIAEEAVDEQRPFISNITPLEGSKSHFGVAVFGGAVKIIDVANRQVLRKYSEHRDRVWTIENIQPHCFASCSDDKSVKIWDSRAARSVNTLGKQIGRVSGVLNLGDNRFVTTACPSDLRKAKEAADLNFWDIRMIAKKE